MTRAQRNTSPTARAVRVAVLAFGLTGAAAVGAGLGAPRVAFAADAVDRLLQQAGEKLRAGESGAAVRLLEQARNDEPGNAEAHLLYQQAALEALGEEAVLNDYKKRAAENADDALFQFLELRLMDPEKSLQKWKSLSNQFKTSPWPAAGWARALEKLGKFKDALEQHDRALTLAKPGDVRFRAFQAYGFERASDWQNAVIAWRAVLDGRPGDRSAHLGLGEALRQTGDIDGALAQFDEVLKSVSLDVEGRYRKALTLVTAERFEDAQKEVDVLLQSKRGMVEGLCVGAEALLRKVVKEAKERHEFPTDKELEPALDYASRAVAADPESAYAHFVHGAILEVQGEYDADRLDNAVETYQKALDLIPFPGPEKVRVLVAKSFVHLRLAEWDMALGLAKSAIQMDERNIAAYAQAAHALVSQSKAEDAIKDYYKPALKFAPDDARLHHGYGTALWDMKKDNDATKELKLAVKFEPDNGLYRLSLGENHYQLRRYKDAVSELFEATVLIPKDPRAWAAYGRACTAEKHYPEAIEAYETVVKLLKPEDQRLADIYLYLAILYDRTKDRTKARESAEKFKELGGADQNLESFIKRLLESTD